jgi:hypothetical protein
MSELDPAKLHVRFAGEARPDGPLAPRRYTLTHSDRTGELFLTIAPSYDKQQVSGWYTRLMRDEVLAEWLDEAGARSLHVHCHVSGGLVVGSAGWRLSIFQRHMRQVLQAFRMGDASLYAADPSLDQAHAVVHYHSHKPDLARVEDLGPLQHYRLTSQPQLTNAPEG